MCQMTVANTSYVLALHSGLAALLATPLLIWFRGSRSAERLLALTESVIHKDLYTYVYACVHAHIHIYIIYIPTLGLYVYWPRLEWYTQAHRYTHTHIRIQIEEMLYLKNYVHPCMCACTYVVTGEGCEFFTSIVEWVLPGWLLSFHPGWCFVRVSFTMIPKNPPNPPYEYVASVRLLKVIHPTRRLSL